MELLIYLALFHNQAVEVLLPPPIKDKSEVGIQTILNGTTVGKMVETTSILADVLGPEDLI